LNDLALRPLKRYHQAFKDNPKFVEISKAFFSLPQLKRYAIADVVNCDDLKKKMSITQFWRDVEMPLTTILFQMERRGIYLDQEKLKKLDEDYTRRVESLMAFFGDTNPNSPKQLAKRLEEEGFDLAVLAEKTDKGAPKLDKLFFKKLDWNGNEFAKNLLAYRKYSKNLNTYIRPLLEYAARDGRVHGSFNQAGMEDTWGEGKGGTATGRLTSSDPNLQNIPARTQEGKEVRSCFIATPGFKMFDADLKQIEPRLVAHYSQAPKLINAYANGLDTHGMFASDIFKKPVEELTKIERFVGKTSWLATVYGCSYRKLLQICELNSDTPLELNLGPYLGLFDKMHPLDKKKILRFHPKCDDVMYAKWMFFKNVQDQFKASNPEIMSWRAHHIARAKLTGFVTTLGGRRIQVFGLNSHDPKERAAAERHCVNYLIQGSAADVMKMVMVAFDKRLVKTGKGFLLATVHDEVLGEYPVDSDDEEMKKLIHDVMCNTVKLNNVSIDSDTKIINNWSEK